MLGNICETFDALTRDAKYGQEWLSPPHPLAHNNSSIPNMFLAAATKDEFPLHHRVPCMVGRTGNDNDNKGSDTRVLRWNNNNNFWYLLLATTKRE